jgi:hypothetical protein
MAEPAENILYFVAGPGRLYGMAGTLANALRLWREASVPNTVIEVYEKRAGGELFYKGLWPLAQQPQAQQPTFESVLQTNAC